VLISVILPVSSLCLLLC